MEVANLHIDRSKSTVGDRTADSTSEGELAVLSDAVSRGSGRSRGSGSGLRSRSRRHYDIKKETVLKKANTEEEKVRWKEGVGKGED